MKVSLFERLIPKRKRLDRLKKTVIDYYSALSPGEMNDDQRQILLHLKHRDLDVFPYDFPDRYDPDNVKVFMDQSLGLFYMLWEGKKLYYRNGKNSKKAQRYFNSLLIEQDIASPHRYLTEDFQVMENDVVVDIGAAEGNFALSIVEKASLVILFEAEKKWIPALEATFRPWRHKVKIIQKYVSDKTEDQFVALDDFFTNGQRVNFIKADVEGAESEVIAGARRLIERQPKLKVALCTYHRQEDAEELDETLQKMNFRNHFSDGYMLFHYGRENVVKAPFLRKAVLRATK